MKFHRTPSQSRAVMSLLVWCLITGCGDNMRQAHIDDEDEPPKSVRMERAKKALLKKFPSAVELPQRKHPFSFTFRLQRELKSLIGSTVCATVDVTDIVERSGSIFVEVSSYPEVWPYLTLKLKDTNNVTASMLKESSELERLQSYAVVFVLKDVLEPEIHLRSEVSGSISSKDVSAEIIIESPSFPILSADLIHFALIE